MCCQQQLNNGVKCGLPAEHSIWIPTWVSAGNGPIFLCENHLLGFTLSKDVHFVLDEKADEAFKMMSRHILRKDEPQLHANTLKMLENGKVLSGKPGIMSYMVAIVDGDVWLGHNLYVSCLGKYDEVKEYFPKLILES